MVSNGFGGVFFGGETKVCVFTGIRLDLCGASGTVDLHASVAHTLILYPILLCSRKEPENWRKYVAR